MVLSCHSINGFKGRNGDNHRRGGTLTLSLVATSLIAVLGATCVAGALAQNRRAGALLRDQQERILRVASAIGVDPRVIDAGQANYATTCTACHGAGGEARPGLGKDIARSEFVREQSDIALLGFLKMGRSTWDPLNTTGVEMPAKGGNPMLTDDDLRELVAYMRYLQLAASGATQ